MSVPVAMRPSAASTSPWPALAVLCLGVFMIGLDTTVLNVAIPSILTDFDAPLDLVLWAVNAYLLAYAVLLAMGGRLGDAYGQRNLFALGLCLFMLASVGCSLAQDSGQLIAARALQGAAAALVSPQIMALTLNLVPVAQRNNAFGILGAVAGVAALAGPTLGGLLVTLVSWRCIFYVNVPIAILALVLCLRVLPEPGTDYGHGHDVIGLVLGGLGLSCLVFALVEGDRFAWGVIDGPLSIPVLVSAGLAALVAFAIWERQHAAPMVPLHLFRSRHFSVMSVVTGVLCFAMLSLFVPLGIYFQNALGMSAFEAGLTIAPMALASIVSAPIVGHLSERIGVRRALIFALLLFAGGMSLLVWRASPSATRSTFLLPAVLAGLGQGGIFGPASHLAMRDVPDRLAGVASGVHDSLRQVGNVLGSAASGAVLQTRLEATLAELGAPPDAQHLASAANGVFREAFVAAMRPALMLPIGLVLAAAIACVAVHDYESAHSR